MTVALFLDVDKTLTEDFIQKQFAILLNCEDDYNKLESQFQQGSITSDQFGKELIALYNQHGFTKAFAETNFDKIKLNAFASDILRLGKEADVFLVSSGPNYYIKRLAYENAIPAERALCSEYKFDQVTGCILSCDAISPINKRDFVAELSIKYKFTIGLGDHPDLDGPFIASCTFRILLSKTVKSGFLCVNTMEEVVRLTRELLKLSRSEELAGTEKLIDIRAFSPRNLSRLTFGSWTLLFSIAGSILALGVLLNRLGVGPS